MSETTNRSSASNRLARRDALRLGGMGVSLAAFIAACGEDRTGDESPGRVGYAPPQTDLPTYPVDDAVLLRTAASLERTIVAVYEEILGSDTLSDDLAALLETLIPLHEEIIAGVDELTTSVGGTPWECTNPWYVDRLIDPALAAISVSDEPERDQGNLAIALEDTTAATMQMFSGMVESIEARVGLATGAADTAQHAATAALVVGGPEAALNPDLTGGADAEETPDVPTMYAMDTTFGSVAQFEVRLGPADENGVRAAFNFATPADNSYIYNELEPTC
jgi:hypothetical protein